MADQTVPAGLSENAASGIAYITIIPAIIFLATAPYNQSKTIRFHSWQSIFLFIAWVAADIALGVVGMLPFIWHLTWMLWRLMGLGFFILVIVCMVQAFNGQIFKVPVIGDLAEKQAGGARV